MFQTLRDKDIFEDVPYVEPSAYQSRTVVKAIVESGNYIGLVTNPIHGFLLLPGGGAETSSLELEIRRECIEELGVEIKIKNGLMRIDEYRNRDSLKYETHCYLATVAGVVKSDMRTAEEKSVSLQSVWLPREDVVVWLEEQVRMVKRGKVDFYNTAFNIIRDDIFFRKYVESHPTESMG